MDLLIGIEELRHLLAQPRLPVLVDTRDAEAYASGHIVGAYNVHGFDLEPPATDMAGLFDFNSSLDHRFRCLGRFEKVHVIVYGDGLDLRSAHTFFLFHYAGQLSTRYFTGGHEGWVRAGGPITTATPTIDPSPFAVRVRREIIARHDEAVAALGDGSALIDVRSAAEFAAGTLPGAVSLPWTRLCTEDHVALQDAPAVAAAFQEVGVDARTPTVLFSDRGCRSGLAWLAAKSAGLRKVRSYLGGLNEWRRDGRPLTGP